MKLLCKWALLSLLMTFLTIPLIAQDKKTIVEVDELEAAESISEASSNERMAMIIGVEKYLNRDIVDLSYAVDDAQFIKNVLEAQGYFSTIYLADDSDILPPTRENILQELDNIITLQELKVEIETFVFYFTGHGFNISGINYLATMEADPRDLDETALSFNVLMEKIKTIQNNGTKVIMFLDACRNDPNTKKKGHQNNTWADTNSTGIKVLYSTSKGDYSYELDGHGVFTMYLVGALLGSADLTINGGNNDKFVSFEETVKYVSKSMVKWSQQSGLKQIPRSDSIEVGGDFLLTVVDEIAFKKPSYVKPLTIDEVSLEGISVSWDTDKETVGELYISEKEGFILHNSLDSFLDNSLDGKKHNTLITYDKLDLTKTYFIKTKDTDFIQNTVLSDELVLTPDKVYDVLYNDFESELKMLKGLIDLYEKQKNFASAELSCKESLKLINKYDKLLNLSNFKREMKKKLNDLKDSAVLSFLFIDTSTGIFTNLINMRTIALYLNLSFNIRINRKSAIGIGVSFLTNVELFYRHSFFNTYGLKNFSTELFLKSGIIVDVYSLIMKDFGLGAMIDLGYLINLNKVLGLQFNFKLWTIYHFLEPHKFNLLPTISMGAVIYL